MTALLLIDPETSDWIHQGMAPYGLTERKVENASP
jgi:hypothetical protein